MRGISIFGRVVVVVAFLLASVSGAGATHQRYYNYCFVVKTSGSRDGAGTDANLRLLVDGSKVYHDDKSNGFSLTALMSGDAFEAGDVDEGRMRHTDWGDIWRIQVKSDGKYAGADWYPNWICISRDGCGPCSAETIRLFEEAGEGGYLCRFGRWVREGASGWMDCTKGSFRGVR